MGFSTRNNEPAHDSIGRLKNIMMKRIQIFLLFLTFLTGPLLCLGQNVQFVETADIQRAMLEYKNRYQGDTELSGYRIQYLFTTDRREMENIQRKFEEQYRSIPHEWVHDQPYYRLYAGSFVDRAAAMQLLAHIRESFPTALLVNSRVTIDQVLECRANLR